MRQSGAQVAVDNASWNGSLAHGRERRVRVRRLDERLGEPRARRLHAQRHGVHGLGASSRTSWPRRTPRAGSPKAGQYTWPGVYFEGRFRGTGVGIVLDDSANDYDVQIDGTTVATLVTPGQTTHWVAT